MSKFRVEKLVDAFIVYSKEVDAASEEEAMDIAQNSNDEGWEFQGTRLFDATDYEVFDENEKSVLSTT